MAANDFEKNANEMAIQRYVGPNDEGFENQQGSPSYKQQPELSGASRKRIRQSESRVAGIKQHQQPSEGESSSKRKRKTEGTEELAFRLFKFPKIGEQYLLETHEVKTGAIDRCHLIVHKTKNGWKVGSYDLAKGDNIVFPMLGDPNPLIFHKRYEFSLQERLVGWTVEQRKRANGKEDSFYYHRGRQFRSFVEMASFILYSSKPKDLELVNNTESLQEDLEAEAVEAMMIISSAGTSSKFGNLKDGALQERRKDESVITNPTEGQKSQLIPTGEGRNDEPIMALADTLKDQKIEPDEIENDTFMDYISDFFEDEDPGSLSKILGGPKI